MNRTFYINVILELLKTTMGHLTCNHPKCILLNFQHNFNRCVENGEAEFVKIKEVLESDPTILDEGLERFFLPLVELPIV